MSGLELYMYNRFISRSFRPSFIELKPMIRYMSTETPENNNDKKESVPIKQSPRQFIMKYGAVGKKHIIAYHMNSLYTNIYILYIET